MQIFLTRLVLFCLPFLLAIPIEISSRNNTFKIKSEYIEKNKDQIEVLILGSSQTNKGLNPAELDFSVAPLANDGSTINLDYLLFERYFEEFPRLKLVVFELSYHGLEDRKKNDWSKNHLFYNFYNVNNYGKKPPLSEKFLISSNPKFYLMRFFSDSNTLEDTQFNEYGFVLNSSSRFEKYDYDVSKIAETSQQEYMAGRHQRVDLNNYSLNTGLLDRAIRRCLDKGMKVILLSPPKYRLYNEAMNREKLERRDRFFSEYQDVEGVYVLNYERVYENDTRLFLNEDHLNSDGVAIFSKELNREFERILND